MAKYARRRMLSQAASAFALGIASQVLGRVEAVAAPSFAFWKKNASSGGPTGVVYSWGTGTCGANGDTTCNSYSTPVAVCNISNSIAVGAGPNSSLSLGSNGCVYAWGNSFRGVLGNNCGSNAVNATPIMTCGISTATKLAVGYCHSLALLADGTVRIWGFGLCGENAAASAQSTPIAFPGVSTAVSIASGRIISVVGLSNGTAMTVGSNMVGSLGANMCVGLGVHSVPVAVCGISTAIAVAGGQTYSAFLLSNGTVKVAGDPSGAGINCCTPLVTCCISTATAIAGGDGHVMALLSNGCILAWGANNCGQLGDNTLTDQSTPIYVCGISTAIAIAGGSYHSLALLSNGTIKAWGDNTSGGLGNNTATDSSMPVSVCGISTAVGIGAGGCRSIARL